MSSLPQNWSPEVGQNVTMDFIKYATRQGADLTNELQMTRMWGQFANEVAGTRTSAGDYMRASGQVPPRTSDYKLYQNGPFSWQTEDLISDIVDAGSDTMRWIPTVAISNGAKKETVGHLEWIAPKGWNGASYSTWLQGLDIGNCDYGPETNWNGFVYEITAGQFSRQSPTFNRLQDLALPYDYARSPKFVLRGPNAGLPLNNDVDFNVAIVAQDALAHLDFVIGFGNLANQPMMEWDGLDTILTANYVTNRLVAGSTGIPSGYSSPLIINGATLANIGALVNKVKLVVRTLRNRASKRRMAIAAGDMAIRMPLVLWQRIAEYLSVNGQIESINRTEVPTDAEERLNRMLTTKTWNIDGQFVTVLIDDNPVVLSGNTATVDVQILTRKMGGMNILEQQYVDYDTVKIPAELEQETTTGLNGIMRYGWIEENKKCFRYFVEMSGRLVSRSQPNQAVIESFTFTLDAADEIEGTTYTDSYYANYGTPGSIGAGAV